MFQEYHSEVSAERNATQQQLAVSLYFQKQLKIDCSFNQFSFPFTSSPVVGKLLHSHRSIGKYSPNACGLDIGAV